MSHHQSAKVMAVIKIEITSDVAISFAHSQYDTNAIPSRPHAVSHHRRAEFVTLLFEMHGTHTSTNASTVAKKFEGSMNLGIASADIIPSGDFRVLVTDQRRQAIILRLGGVALLVCKCRRNVPGPGTDLDDLVGEP